VPFDFVIAPATQGHHGVNIPQRGHPVNHDDA